ncbi:MAG: hypothetical protein JW763_06975 [candidate division Zixibacteria bacterium]|nr:hypothetical protein [candidate division Zixibacteria bacterium]
MPGRKLAFIVVCVLLAASAFAASSKHNAAAFKPTQMPIIQTLQDYPRLITGDTCTVAHHQELMYFIQSWVVGSELYKAYQDPEQTCTNPYPFSVEEIHIALHIHQACEITVSVDVETADNTDPSCPFPGALLSISQSYALSVPDSGLYLVSIPLDSAAVVDEPYFAGFYIDALATGVTIDLITDEYPVLCTGYNIWDEAVGYIDVNDNTYFSFPGRMVLFSSGTTGGGGGGDDHPEPSITLLTPQANNLILGDAVIWGAETSGSGIIDYVIFDYKGTGGWTQITYDYDASRPLRNGVDPAGSGTGFSTPWNYTSLTEGTYRLKATVFDTLWRTGADSIQVYVDPTPPSMTFADLAFFDKIHTPYTLTMLSPDENITEVVFERKDASITYDQSLLTLNQAAYGGGADGDYYCGPVAAAIAIKYWYDQGYSYLMREGASVLPIDTVVERLAQFMQTRENDGTYDEQFLLGLSQYILAHGNEIDIAVYRDPDYALFRTLFQEREQSVILALSGTPGLYLTTAGVSGTPDALGQCAITVSDPISGQLLGTTMRDGGDRAEVYYGGDWHPVDLIITLEGDGHSVTRYTIGADNTSGDWSMEWTDTALDQDSLYFITATATDATGHSATATVLIQYDATFTAGDYNGDELVNLGDVLYLIEYVFKDGPAPIGGAGRADANCDSNIDLSDVIYVIKHIYGNAPQPCY